MPQGLSSVSSRKGWGVSFRHSRTLVRRGSSRAAPNETRMPCRNSWSASCRLPVKPCTTHVPWGCWRRRALSSLKARTQWMTIGFCCSSAMAMCQRKSCCCRCQPTLQALSIPHSPISCASSKRERYFARNSSMPVASSFSASQGWIAKLRGVTTPSAVSRCVWKSMNSISLLRS